MSDESNKSGDNLKGKAGDLANEAKETAQDFTKNAKETFLKTENKKVLVGVLAILVGGLGVHKFVLGYQKEGFVLLGISLAAYALSCVIIGLFFIWIPPVVGLIEGIVYLTKSNEEFYQTYQVNKKTWF